MRVEFKNVNRKLRSGRTISSTERLLSIRDRILEAACESFSESGFHGTHLREICKRAGTNVAGVCYHFENKEGLYQAVMREAGMQLSEVGAGVITSQDFSPEQNLLAITESLLERLNSKRAWIAKLLARELVDHTEAAHSYAASRLEWDFVLLQAVLRKFPGVDSDEDVRLHAVALIGECVFHALVRENPRHPLNELTRYSSTEALARFLTQRTLRALPRGAAPPEVSKP